ncbi:two-component regulator propeller domain-containing protein [Dyella sp. Tek66A03]|uniref:two-component regulator propeller domain-containing protein n=1 Tax=Dyella sp. Tek66A03 TaxID=3458298 RepID=UPI00403E7172
MALDIFYNLPQLGSSGSTAQSFGHPCMELLTCMTHAYTKRVAGIALGIVLLVTSPLGWAQGLADRSIGQLYHTAWTVKEHSPGQVSAIVQTPDGYLWLGTDAGLFRFDGIRFERFEDVTGKNLPSITVQSLHVATDGALWIGFQREGISVWNHDKLVNYGGGDGLPVGTVLAVQIDLDGVVWASLSKGLYRLHQRRWERVDVPNADARNGSPIFIDRKGTLWYYGGKTVLKLPWHASAFVDTGDNPGVVGFFAEDANGTVWVSTISGTGGVRPVRGQGPAYDDMKGIPVRSAGLLFDRNGHVWVTTLGHGVLWYRSSATALASARAGIAAVADDSFSHDEGLSSDYTWPIFQGRESNVWIGSGAGLDRFRPSAAVPAAFPRAMHDLAMAVDADGSIWAGSTTHPLMRLKDDTLQTFDNLPPELTCAYKDTDGSLWFGGDKGIWHIEHGRPQLIVSRLPSEIATQMQAMTRDRSGALWASGFGYPLSKYEHGAWHAVDNIPGLPAGERAHAMTTDTRGRVWLGYANGSLYAIDGDSVSAYGSNQGISLGSIAQILDTGRHLWIAGDQGLAAFDGTRLHRMQTDHVSDLKGIAGVVEAPAGDLWIHTIKGLAHISADQVNGFLRNDRMTVQLEWFDYLDGLPGPPTQLRPLPSMVRGNDGRLWLATSAGGVWLDPNNIPHNPLPPPVQVTSVIADSRAYDLHGELTLPKGTINLQIDYTALSLTLPERMQFRYRLEGIDKNWREAGHLRQAIYTNLAPGHYRFFVTASNNDGVWNAHGTDIDFNIAPWFYQTLWFQSLCTVLAFLMAALLYLWRMRAVASHVLLRLQERTSERERIARELHDTLLQGVQGLLLRLQATTAELDSDNPIRKSLDSAVHRARCAVIEARDKIIALREQGEPENLLPTLRSLGDELAATHGPAFLLTIFGVEAPLHAVTAKQVLDISREALRNAFLHANADVIQVEVDYGQQLLRVLIHDDGIGVPPDPLNHARETGRWGLIGMYERARTIGATLAVYQRESRGTSVSLSIPGYTAYRCGRVNMIRRQFFR